MFQVFDEPLPRDHWFQELRARTGRDIDARARELSGEEDFPTGRDRFRAREETVPGFFREAGQRLTPEQAELHAGLLRLYDAYLARCRAAAREMLEALEGRVDVTARLDHFQGATSDTP